jgi:hypothetical protein
MGIEGAFLRLAAVPKAEWRGLCALVVTYTLKTGAFHTLEARWRLTGSTPGALETASRDTGWIAGFSAVGVARAGCSAEISLTVGAIWWAVGVAFTATAVVAANERIAWALLIVDALHADEVVAEGQRRLAVGVEHTFPTASIMAAQASAAVVVAAALPLVAKAVAAHQVAVAI